MPRGVGLLVGLLFVLAPGCEQKAPKKRVRDKAAAKKEPLILGGKHQTARADDGHPAACTVRFDVAFVVDSTASMAKLIQAAKDRIREVAAFVRRGTPGPSVRYGLVAYRDRHDAYITRLYGFSPDITKTEQALGELQARGGGDLPEHVVAGLRRAVNDLAWDDTAKLKMILLIGDAPAHLDYGSESDIDAVLSEAKNRNIVIGTIALHTMPPNGIELWKKVAETTGGPAEGMTAEVVAEAVESVVKNAIAEQAKKAGVSYPAQTP